MIYRTTILFFSILFTINVVAQDWKKYPYEPVGKLISFPVDEGAQEDEPTEWWYSTGQVVGNTTGTTYTYVVIYFYGPQLGFDGFRLLNVMNEDTGEKFFDSKPVNYSKLGKDRLQIKATGLLIPKTETFENQFDSDDQIIPFKYDLFAATSNTELDLQLNTVKRPLILGENGLFEQGSTSYTYYYSQTGIEVTGTLKFFDVTETVTGTGWIDRQYGDFDRNADERYEWFSAQLSNGMDLNLWNIFAKDYSIPDDLKYKMLSAYVDEDTQYFTKDFTLERLNYFCTPDGEMCYSKKWRLVSEKNKIDLIITANKEDSEASLPIRFYEGGTTITGTVNGVNVTGIGFAELLHSYEGPELEITYPDNGAYNTAEEISWKVLNPDDGNPLKYDITYSIDNKESFTTIVEGIQDPSYLWPNPDIKEGDNIWFKIIGYSVDKTLTSNIVSESSSTITLSLEDIEGDQLSIYPNPVNNLIKIKIPGIPDDVNYQVYDTNGRILAQELVRNTKELEINTQTFQPGLYILKLSNGKKVLYSKFLVN